MKSVVVAFLVALTSGQTPPGTTAAGAAQTTAAAAATATAAGTTVPPIPVPPVAVTTTAAPIIPTPMPTTALPTTAAPTPNMYCPAAVALEKIGNQPMATPGFPTSQNAFCQTSSGQGSIARDFQGMLTCNDYHCCLCSEINCGGSGYPCDTLKISSSGGVGVQNIAVIGSPTIGMWGGGGLRTGADIHCSGLEACKASVIRGKAIHQIKCSADFACEGAYILLEPAEGMQAQFTGMMSAMNSVIEIIVTSQTAVSHIQTIEFNGQQTAQGATVIIRNQGRNTLYVEQIECMNPTACPNTIFVIEGNVQIEQCDLAGHTNLHALPPQMQACMLSNIGYSPYTPYNPNPVQPFPNPGQNVPAPLPAVPAPLPAVPAPLPAVPAPLPAVPAPLPAVPAPLPAVPAPAPVAPVTPSGPANVVPYTPINSWQALVCQDMILCRGQNLVISPADTWKLECTKQGACQGMVLTLNVGLDVVDPTNMVEIDVLKFSADYAGVGATIHINNVLGYGEVRVQDIRCEKIGSCEGLTIKAGPGVDIWSTQVDCQVYGSCNGCTVTDAAGVSMPCAAVELAQGGGANVPQQFPQQQFPQQLPWNVYV